MKQTYIINNCKSFRVKDVFDCGQCFRWNEELDKSYTGIFGKNVLNVKQEPDEEGYKITFTGVCNGNIEDICKNYFDLNRDYEEIKNKLSKIDEFMAQSISYGEGIRILNQDLWEMIISFIISANNNIPRIKGIIERMSKKYGEEIEFRGKKYYTFPTIEALKNASKEELRTLGMGFRDKYIYETTKIIADKTSKRRTFKAKWSRTKSCRLYITIFNIKKARCISNRRMG